MSRKFYQAGSLLLLTLIKHLLKLSRRVRAKRCLINKKNRVITPYQQGSSAQQAPRSALLRPYQQGKILLTEFNKRKFCLIKLHLQLDQNKDGLISKKQFVHSIGGGLVTQKHYIGLWLEKVVRNMKTLKIHLQQKRLTAQNIIKLADHNNDQQLDIKQFSHFMNIIEFPITNQQIQDIFKVLDHDKSGKITLEELENYYVD